MTTTATEFNLISAPLGCDGLDFSSRKGWKLIENEHGLYWSACCLSAGCKVCNNAEIGDTIVGRIAIVEGLWEEAKLDD